MTENRVYPRYPLSLDVAVTVSGGESFFCTARDFCFGGMHLLFNTQFTLGVPRHLQLGAQLVVDFTNPNAPESGSQQFEGCIVRSDPIGFAIAFTSQNFPALQILQQLTRSGSGGDEMVGDKGEYAPLVEQLGDHIEGFAEQLISETLVDLDGGLLRLAGMAANNDEQNQFFLLINTLKGEQEGIKANFKAGLATGAKVLTERMEVEVGEEKPLAKSKLSLIDKVEFSDWLVLTTLISRLESRFSDQLYALERRLTAVGVTAINKQNNPVGPYRVAHAFQDVMRQFELTQSQGELIYKLFEKQLREGLEELYEELNELLIAAGVIPDISDEYEFIAPASGNAYGGEQPAEVAVDDAPVERAPPPSSSVEVRQPPASRPAIPGQAMPSYPSPAAAAPMSQGAFPAAGNVTGQPPLPVSQQITGQGFTALSSMMSFSRHAPSPQHPGAVVSMSTAAPIDLPQVAYYPNTQLLQGLDWLSSQQGSIAQLRQQGHTVLGSLDQYMRQEVGDDEQNWGINEQQGETLQFVENLLDYFQSDQLISDLSRDWIARLEIPLLKAAILDPEILHNNEHPAHQVVNRIDELGSALASQPEEQRKKGIDQIEALIAWIIKEVDSNPGVFSDALVTLNEQQKSQQDIYDKNIKKVLDEYEKVHQLNQARVDLVEELNLRIGDRKVARIVIALLDSGWKNLLLSTYLHKGAESAIYQHHINILDHLNARLTGQAAFSDELGFSDNDLFSWASQVLSKVAKDKERAKQLLNTLKYLLKGKVAEVQTVHVPRLSAELFQATKGATNKGKPEGLSNSEWYQWLDRADALKKDDLIKYVNDNSKEEILKLIWIDKAFAQYVFVNRIGEKVRDINIDTLAGDLYSQKMLRVDEWDTPIMERATFSLFDKLHQQFSAQANKDGLTGLNNRRFFERYIGGLIEKRDEDATAHIFCYFDLDRFNLINNTCGYDSGDTLLLQFATILKDGFGDEAIIGRLGDDEFGVMIEGIGRTKGLAMTNRILDSLHSFSFSCSESDFAITASIGLVEFDENFTSVSDVMRAAESACFSAKEAGRDNIQIYNPDNVHLAQRQSQMEWVGRINKLFDADLIKLRCQKITPLKPHIHSLPHYEVLLDVSDEQGNRVPTEEFIVAAEQYSRIHDIDHWVVNKVLDWVEANHSIIKKRIGGFSINLSGSSLNDKKFMDKLHERMIDISFPAELITFEITETLAIKNIDNAARFMATLKETGCGFSLDDFGSGVSSYSYLKLLPVDYLKIDGIFIRELATNINDYAVVKSINEICHVMGKTTIAEYAEDEIIVQILRDIGIDYAQGYGIQKPKPLDSLIGK